MNIILRVPVVVAGLGLIGTAFGALGGAWLTQRRADRREELNWNWDLELEQARCAREGTARTYVDFYQPAAATGPGALHVPTPRLAMFAAARRPSLMCCPPCSIDPCSLAIFFFPLPDLGDALRHRDLEGFGPRGVREVGDRHARQPASYCALDVAEASFFFG